MVRQENPKIVISPVIAEAVNTVSFLENLFILAYMATSSLKKFRYVFLVKEFMKLFDDSIYICIKRIILIGVEVDKN